MSNQATTTTTADPVALLRKIIEDGFLSDTMRHRVRQFLDGAPAAESAGPIKLYDSQWVNIVNHANCWADYSKEDAVHEAVKMTEQAIKANYQSSGTTESAKPVRPETTSEHIARDMREGRFPQRSEPQMVPTAATADAQGDEQERFDNLIDILAEYRKGCSNTMGEGPENCPECVRAFVEAVQRYADSAKPTTVHTDGTSSTGPNTGDERPLPTSTEGRDPITHAVASLAAAISLLERTPNAKKAAASDKMFDQMLADYRVALKNARAALAAARPEGGNRE